MQPTNKVMAGALAGALSIIGAWALKSFGHIDAPAEVTAAAQLVITFLVQYAVPDSGGSS